MPRPVARAVAVLTAALVAAAIALVAAPTSVAASDHPDPHRPTRTVHVQLNLCLSGLAGCFARTAYPMIIDEAVATIETARADSVVINEACSGDAATIAERTGLHLTFATVIYDGAPLPCTNPTGRGEFGNAVLTADPVVAVTDRAYGSQLGKEERRLTCVGTDHGLTVCGTHLALAGEDGSAETANQRAQCREWRAALRDASRRGRAVIASGDLNRQTGCGPVTTWLRRDTDASQAQGIQHVYGTRAALLRPRASTVPMTYTDHDALVVTAYRIG